jgi:hypothetical protein
LAFPVLPPLFPLTFLAFPGHVFNFLQAPPAFPEQAFIFCSDSWDFQRLFWLSEGLGGISQGLLSLRTNAAGGRGPAAFQLGGRMVYELRAGVVEPADLAVPRRA